MAVIVCVVRAVSVVVPLSRIVFVVVAEGVTEMVSLTELDIVREEVTVAETLLVVVPVRVVETDLVVMGELDEVRVGSADRVPVREIGPETLDVGLRVAPVDRVVVREEEIVAVPDFVGWTDTDGVDVVVVVREPVGLRVAVPEELEERLADIVRDPVDVPVGLRVPLTVLVAPADLVPVREPDAEVDGLRVPVVVRVEVMVDEGERVPVEVRE